MANVFTPERQENESFEEYKARRKQAQQLVKEQRKGWEPTIFVQQGKQPGYRAKKVK